MMYHSNFYSSGPAIKATLGGHISSYTTNIHAIFMEHPEYI